LPQTGSELQHRSRRQSHLDQLTQGRLQRGAEHRHRIGARATAELLAEVGDRIGGMPCILGLLAEYEWHLTPQMVRAAGGDCFPPHRLREASR
jgi:hypothetical protein